MGFDELIQHDLSEMTAGIGNGLTGGDGSPVGIADGGVGNSELDNSDGFTFNGDLTLAQGDNNYLLQNPAGSALSLKREDAGGPNLIAFTTSDADGTDSVILDLFGVGGPGQTDQERLRVQFESLSDRYSLETTASGSGTARPIHISANFKTDQLVARTDGNVAMNNGLLVGSTGAATNALGVSGGAVIGSGFAGSNTAPTDGLLVEGKVGIGTTPLVGKLSIDGELRSTNSGPENRAAEFENSNYDGNGNTVFVGLAEGSQNYAVQITNFLVGGNIAFGVDHLGQGYFNSGVGIGTTSPVNTLGVNGAAVIGSSFAGSNTAPSDGLLVEGKIEMSSNGAGLFVNSNGDVVAIDDSGNTNVLT